MTLSSELLASLADCPLDWELLPLNGRKQPIDPVSGRLLSNWSACGTDVDGIAAVSDSSHVMAVGLLLGPQSGGVLAVDFDGPHSVSKFTELFGHTPKDVPASIAVTSGRPQRGCLFLSVDRENWPHMRRRVSWSDPDGETCLELRWDRHYQAIAGSHPLTNGYQWVTSPSQIAIPAPAPNWLLEPLIMQERHLEPYVPAAGDAERALTMLGCLPPADFQSYDRWLDIGMALHSVDPGLLSAWMDWSRGMANFDEAECLAKWESFKGGGITIATLHHHAKAHGYQPLQWGGGVCDVGKIPPPSSSEGGVSDVGKIRSRWIVRDFLAPGVMILGAEMGSGKSSLLYHCCESVQHGTPFLDQFPTTQGRCLVIQADEPEASARMKFQRMDITPTFEIIFRDPGPMDLPWLEKIIASKRYNLIGLDSLGTLLSSDKCEATDASMSRLIYPLNKAFVDHGVAAVLAHHLNKPADRMLRKSVNHHDIGGAASLLAACTDIWSLCRSPNEPDSFDLACHGKRNCRKGTILHLKGNEEDYSWELCGTSDGLKPQERFHLEQLILNHFANNPAPLPLDQLAQCMDTSYEHTRRVALDLFDNNQQITRKKLIAQGRGRPKYLYGPAT